MIPGDLLNLGRPRLGEERSLQIAPTAKTVSDLLSELVPGQKILAEVHSLLPNGTYRAIINQRDVTLALPFAAKSGDALELEVVDTDGKLTLAVLNHRIVAPEAKTDESAPTTLSRPGQLISDLLSNQRSENDRSAGAILNANQPILPSPPRSAADILPALKQAIVESGMFYEAHQAEWVEGKFSKEALLQEPQGKLPPLAGANETQVPKPADKPSAGDPQPPQASNATATPDLARPTSPLSPEAKLPQTQAPTHTFPPGAVATAAEAENTRLLAQETLPLVQQQLAALASQNFVWQGQIWPGQQMRWEIEEEDSAENGDGESTGWKTRLQVSLPALGDIDLRISLRDKHLSVSTFSQEENTPELLQASGEALRASLAEAGLLLQAFDNNPAEKADG